MVAVVCVVAAVVFVNVVVVVVVSFVCRRMLDLKPKVVRTFQSFSFVVFEAHKWKQEVSLPLLLVGHGWIGGWLHLGVEDVTIRDSYSLGCSSRAVFDLPGFHSIPIFYTFLGPPRFCPHYHAASE